MNKKMGMPKRQIINLKTLVSEFGLYIVILCVLVFVAKEVTGFGKGFILPLELVIALHIPAMAIVKLLRR